MNKKQIFGKHYRRLLTEAIIKSVLSGISVSFLINGVFSFLYWMLTFGSAWLGTAIGLPLGVAFGIVIYYAKFKLTEKTLARRIDSHGLEERMITMVELQGENSSIAELQRTDAAENLADFPAKEMKFKIPAWLIVIASSVIAVSLLFGALSALADSGLILYGKDIIAQGGDGTFEVVYTTEGEGAIRGKSEQSVGYGLATEPVRAIAGDGWMFVGWDDGVTSPERCESNVFSDITVKAVFKKIDSGSADEEDSDSADDLPYGSVIEESGGGNSDQLGGDNVKDDGDSEGGGKFQDRNQFIDGATYYRDYLEFYYQYSTGIFESETDIPPEILEFFETYFDGI